LKTSERKFIILEITKLDSNKLYIANIQWTDILGKHLREDREVKISLDKMAGNAEQAESFLKQLANRNRLMILCVLTEGELSVTELNTRVPISQSALSQHLAKLREAGLVSTRRESQTVYYSLDDPDVSLIIGCLYQKYCQ